MNTYELIYGSSGRKREAGLGFLRRLLRLSGVLLLVILLFARGEKTVLADPVMMAQNITRDQFVAAVKNVADTARKKGYKYGDSRSAVPTADGKISCDRLVAKALYDLGFHDQETGGITVGSMRDYLRAHGFKESHNSFSAIGYGSIVVVKHTTVSYYSHTFVTLNFDVSSRTFDSYDCGSQTRIQTTQPFRGSTWYSGWRTNDFWVYNIPDNYVPPTSDASTADDSASTDTAAAETKVVKPKKVELDTTDLMDAVGETYTLSATITPSEAENPGIVWSSSNEAVASVTGDGKISLLSAGSAQITALIKGTKKSAVCNVTVYETPVTKVSLNADSRSMNVGATVKLKAKVSPSSATHKEVSFASSNTAVAQVDAVGNITAVGPGKTVITAVAGQKKAACKVTVKSVPVRSVSLSKTKITIKKGKSRQLKAVIRPFNATDRRVSWRSSDKKVATVNAQGVVTAHRKGSCQIAVVTKDGKKKAVCRVEVK